MIKSKQMKSFLFVFASDAIFTEPSSESEQNVHNGSGPIIATGWLED